MGWHYKPPQVFPALYLNILREASSAPDVPQLFYSSNSRSEVEVIAERFRHFRWCIRQDPTAHKEMSRILADYDVRATIDTTSSGHLLYVVAKPTKVSEFIRLNPALAEAILPQIEGV